MRLSRRVAALAGRAPALAVRLRRPLLVIGRVCLLAAMAAAAVAGGRLLERHLRSAAAFATREIEVTGLGREPHLLRADVLAAAGLRLGKNVFETSPEQAKARLLAHPWIAEAAVTRRLPGGYQIALREHRPVALLALEALYLVSEEGLVFKPLEPGDPADFPVITGVSVERFRAELGLRTALLESAVALLHDWRDTGLVRREPLAEIHAEPDGGFTLYAGHDSMLVRLGKPPFRRKLRRLRGVLDELREDEARPAYVYLDNERRPDRVAVRLR